MKKGWGGAVLSNWVSGAGLGLGFKLNIPIPYTFCSQDVACGEWRCPFLALPCLGYQFHSMGGTRGEGGGLSQPHSCLSSFTRLPLSLLFSSTRLFFIFFICVCVCVLAIEYSLSPNKKKKWFFLGMQWTVSLLPSLTRLVPFRYELQFQCHLGGRQSMR